MFRSRAISGLAILVLGVVLLADAGFAATTITFASWAAPDSGSGAAYKAMIDRFNASQSEVVVEYRLYPGSTDAARDKVLVEWVAGGGPDVTHMSITWPGEFVEKGVLLPLRDLGLSLESLGIMENLRASARFSGKPDQVIPFMSIVMEPMWYNVDHFNEAGLDAAQPPATWDDLVAVGRKLTKRTVADQEPERWGIQRVWWFPMWIVANNGTWLNPDGTFAWNSPEGRGAVQFVVDLVNTYEVATYNIQPAFFYSGKSSIYFEGSWVLDPMQQQSFPVAVAPPPQRVAGTPRIDASFHSLGVPVHLPAAKRQAVASFLKFATSAEGQAIMAVGGAGLPVNAQAFRQRQLMEFVQKNPLASATMDITLYAVPRPFTVRQAETDNIWKKMLSDAVGRKGDPLVLLAEATRMANIVLLGQ
jgi:ABC-type glycerol-3-phosphate transport system substrate-binding protein